jgi:ribonucleotide reductase beta subunit family protein with ferritin-like domain
MKSQIQTPTTSYRRCYPKLVELANKQLEDQFWTSTEMKVELDKMQLKYELNQEQLHAVKTLLAIFLRYELIVGEEFWMNRVAKAFPRPEVKIAASVVGMSELAIHAEFYNQINIVLGIDKDKDYVAYTKDKDLRERVEWLGEMLDIEDDVLAVAIFSMTETALLFSAFAIFKSFQSNGYNLIPVIVRGTNQSAIDEDLHGIISAEIINTHYAEIGMKLVDDKERYPKILEAVQKVFEHECRIIDLTIPNEMFNGVPKQHYKEYVKYRLNTYLTRLGCPEYFTIGECDIPNWFELNTYSYKMIDFFTAGVGMEYESSWDSSGFIRGLRKENEIAEG